MYYVVNKPSTSIYEPAIQQFITPRYNELTQLVYIFYIFDKNVLDIFGIYCRSTAHHPAKHWQTL